MIMLVAASFSLRNKRRLKPATTIKLAYIEITLNYADLYHIYY